MVNGWNVRRRRWTGAIALAVTGLLTVTGWLLYYVGDEGGRAAVSTVHWVIGLAGLTAFLAHRLQPEARCPAVGARKRPPRPKP